VKQIIFLAMLLLLITGSLHAQRGTHFEAGGGLAATFIKSPNSDSRFKARVLPHAGIAAIIPVEGRFSFKTGCQYEQRGWRASSSTSDTDLIRTEVSSSVKLHAISIPLAIRFALAGSKNMDYSLSAGMSYAFFIEGRNEATIESYRGDKLLSSTSTSWDPYIALIPDNDKLEQSADGTAYFMFSPSVRIEATAMFRKRYAIQVFGGYGLAELRKTLASSPALQMHYCGIALNVILR
jgi:hypothetical protein